MIEGYGSYVFLAMIVLMMVVIFYYNETEKLRGDNARFKQIIDEDLGKKKKGADSDGDRAQSFSPLRL